MAFKFFKDLKLPVFKYLNTTHEIKIFNDSLNYFDRAKLYKLNGNKSMKLKDFENALKWYENGLWSLHNYSNDEDLILRIELLSNCVISHIKLKNFKKALYNSKCAIFHAMYNLTNNKLHRKILYNGCFSAIKCNDYKIANVIYQSGIKYFPVFNKLKNLEKIIKNNLNQIYGILLCFAFNVFLTFLTFFNVSNVF